jgi:hypothetical protein
LLEKNSEGYDKNVLPENKKHILITVMSLAVLLLVAGAALGVWSAGQMRKDITDQFNQEQAVIADNLSGLIEREF